MRRSPKLLGCGQWYMKESVSGLAKSLVVNLDRLGEQNNLKQTMVEMGR